MNKILALLQGNNNFNFSILDSMFFLLLLLFFVLGYSLYHLNFFCFTSFRLSLAYVKLWWDRSCLLDPNIERIFKRHRREQREVKVMSNNQNQNPIQDLIQQPPPSPLIPIARRLCESNACISAIYYHISTLRTCWLLH